MGWQRFNRATRVFEVSDDNGGSWQTLKIATAGTDAGALPSNVAYIDQPNVFTQPQTINGPDNTPLLKIGTGGDRPAFRATSGILEVTRADNANWVSVKANNFYSIATGNNLGDLLCRGATDFQQGISVTAGAGRHTQLTSYVYVNTSPGALDASIFMVNSAGPGSYKTFRILNYNGALQVWRHEDNVTLFTLDFNGNTYYAGYIDAHGPGIRVRTSGFYEGDSGLAMGYWTSWYPGVTDAEGRTLAFNARDCRYTVIGRTVFWFVYFDWVTFTVPSIGLRVATPPGFVPAGGSGRSWAPLYTQNIGWERGMVTPGSGYLEFWRGDGPANNWQGNANHIFSACGFYVY